MPFTEISENALRGQIPWVRVKSGPKIWDFFKRKEKNYEQNQNIGWHIHGRISITFGSARL